jgi:hypothetical protein
LARTVPAGGALDAATAACTVVPTLDDAEEEPVEGEDAGFAPGEAALVRRLLGAMGVDGWPA